MTPAVSEEDVDAIQVELRTMHRYPDKGEIRAVLIAASRHAAAPASGGRDWVDVIALLEDEAAQSDRMSQNSQAPELHHRHARWFREAAAELRSRSAGSRSDGKDWTAHVNELTAQREWWLRNHTLPNALAIAALYRDVADFLAALTDKESAT